VFVVGRGTTFWPCTVNPDHAGRKPLEPLPVHPGHPQDPNHLSYLRVGIWLSKLLFGSPEVSWERPCPVYGDKNPLLRSQCARGCGE